MMSGTSFSLDRLSSLKGLGRSDNLLLATELVSSESSTVVGYERLSGSVRWRADHCWSGGHRSMGSRGWALLSKVFALKKINAGSADVVVNTQEMNEAKPQQAAEKEVNGSRRSSWLPDPKRRWPVQGW